MASKFNKGDSIFFLFREGETVLDSQLKPRFYLTEDMAKRYLPFGDEIVEYAAVRHGRWDAKIMKDIGTYTVYWCSECNCYSYFKYNYCPNCGAKMRGNTDE